MIKNNELIKKSRYWCSNCREFDVVIDPGKPSGSVGVEWSECFNCHKMFIKFTDDEPTILVTKKGI